MYSNDFDQFRQIMDTLSEVFAKPKLSDAAIAAYWEALKDQHIAAVERAAKSHGRYGKFFPKPAELRPKTEKAPEPQDEKAINESERASVETWETMRIQDPAKFWRMFAKAYIGRLHFRFAEGSPEFVSSVERCLSRCNTELIRLGEVGISETEIDTGMAYQNPTGTVSKRVSAEIADEWVF
jgi:hypothetical protein